MDGLGYNYLGASAAVYSFATHTLLKLGCSSGRTTIMQKIPRDRCLCRYLTHIHRLFLLGGGQLLCKHMFLVSEKN